MLSPVASNNLLSLLKRFNTTISPQRVQHLHTTCSCPATHQYHPKGPYRDFEEEERVEKLVKIENRKQWYGLRNGFKLIRDEVGKWKDEWHERLTDDSVWNVRPGDREELFRFDKPESLENWNVVCDGDHNEGQSRSSLTLSPTGKGLFQGYINAKVPIDGTQHRAGFASVTSKRKIKSFQREDVYDWEAYTHFVLRVRGDGRAYMVNLHCKGYFDVEWFDMWHYPIYTRGGPYWQDIKIPFSKFVFAHKGRVQDMQRPISRIHVNSVGLTLSKIEGPFSLEIDYLGVECDPHNEEEFAYEDYAVPLGMAQY